MIILQLHPRLNIKQFMDKESKYYLSDKRDLNKSDRYVVLSNLSIYYTWDHIKLSYF